MTVVLACNNKNGDRKFSDNRLTPGMLVILNNRYGYTRGYTNADGSVTWRCRSKNTKCKAKIRTSHPDDTHFVLISISNQEHECPLPAHDDLQLVCGSLQIRYHATHLQYQQLKTAIRESASRGLGRPAEIVNRCRNEIAKIDDAKKLPSNKALVRDTWFLKTFRP